MGNVWGSHAVLISTVSVSVQSTIQNPAFKVTLTVNMMTGVSERLGESTYPMLKIKIDVGEVENLAASLRSSIPELSVTLRWDVPRKNREDEITAYDIRFRPKDEEVYSNETSVDGAFKTITLTSTSGIAPLTTYEFEVRARIRDAVGKWKMVIASVPGPVQNIRAVVDPMQASIKLNWDPPLDFKRPGKGTTYRVRFKPEGTSNYVEKVVTTNHVSLTRKSGLQASNMHKFEVRAENVEAPGEWKIYSAYVALVPDPVQNLSATVDKDIPSVTLSWICPGNIQIVQELTEYHIHFKPCGNKEYFEKTVTGSTTSIVLTRGSGLVPLKDYHFQVCAQSNCYKGEWKEVTSFFALKPGEVQNLRSTLNTNEASLTLNWDQPNNVITAEDVTAYDIRFKISGSGGGNNYYSMMTVNAPARSIHLTRESGLKPLTKYSFEVRARNFHCQGEWSCISKYIALHPDPVKNLSITVDENVTLSWDPPVNIQSAEEVSEYQIHFKPDGSGHYNEMTVRDSCTASIDFTQLVSSKKYNFKVRARNDSREGKWEEASVFCALVPGQVQNLRSTLDTNAPTLTLHWDKPRNMTTDGDVKSYDIRFKPCGREGNYCQKTVVAPATSILLTRESGLKPLTKYILEVRARSNFQEGKWSGLSEYIALHPDLVQTLSVTIDENVTLNWNPPVNIRSAEEVNEYQIRFKSNGSRHYNEVTVRDSCTATIDFTQESGLVSSKNYKFEVRAQNDCGAGEWVKASTFCALVPGHVQNVRSTLDTNALALTLNWDKPKSTVTIGDEMSYDIRFKPTGSGWEGNYFKMNVNPPATSILLTRESGLKPMTKYDFEIRAQSFYHEGKWTKHSKYIALVPGGVQNLRSDFDPSKPSLTLNWDRPFNAQTAEDVGTYNIRFRPSGRVREDAYCEMTVKSPTTSIVLTREDGLKPLTKYDFEVRAQNDDHEGEWSTVSEYIALVPGQVQNLTSTLDTNVPSLTLNWDKPSNVKTAEEVTAYDIRFRSAGRWWRKGYHKMTVDSLTTSVCLTRENGLDPLTTHEFEVRARNFDHEGEWSNFSEQPMAKFHCAVVPGQVQNLKSTLNTNAPSLTLNWDKPSNVKAAEDVTAYDIRFRPAGSSRSKDYHKMTVDSPATSVLLTRENGLNPLTTYDFEVRARNAEHYEGQWSKVSKYIALTPDPVQNLTVAMATHEPSVTLNWDPPANAAYPGYVTKYIIRFWDNDSGYHGEEFVDGSTTTTIITRESGLRLLATFTFKVRAYSGDDASQEWRTVSRFIALIPGQVRNLRSTLTTHSLNLNWDRPSNAKISGVVTAYEVHFRPSRSTAGDGYSKVIVNAPTTSILLTEASGFQPLIMYDLEVRARNDGHKGRWSKLKSSGVVKLDSESQEYTNLCKKFHRDWAIGKGPCPSIVTIAKIIDPVVLERFESYCDTLKVQGIEQHYHGTRLCCDLANSAKLCDNPDCGTCGIARIGFDPQKINSVSFQRFGEGFYFAPNSSKAYDYAIGKRFGAPVRDRNTHYSSVFLCDIAPGRKYTLQFRDPLLSKPPPGYDSFYGENRAVTGRGELNYDELVIFDHRAIYPRYIIFCQSSC